MRYNKSKSFCTLVPEYRLFSVVVMGEQHERSLRSGVMSSAQLVSSTDEAKTYIDGKWLTIAISSADDLHDVTELLTVKRPPHVSSASHSNSASRSSRKAPSR
ncbi:DUF3788 family protein [Mesorhizobium sp. LMG 17147]|uniref:DUF3788 family protein n=1 Tax=Mesorhizobium sp. LMG 17147 TaxID=2963091 RepID=UPI0034A25FB1